MDRTEKLDEGLNQGQFPGLSGRQRRANLPAMARPGAMLVVVFSQRCGCAGSGPALGPQFFSPPGIGAEKGGKAIAPLAGALPPYRQSGRRRRRGRGGGRREGRRGEPPHDSPTPCTGSEGGRDGIGGLARRAGPSWQRIGLLPSPIGGGSSGDLFAGWEIPGYEYGSRRWAVPQRR